MSYLVLLTSGSASQAGEMSTITCFELLKKAGLMDDYNELWIAMFGAQSWGQSGLSALVDL